jgi:hypothetical protein
MMLESLKSVKWRFLYFMESAKAISFLVSKHIKAPFPNPSIIVSPHAQEQLISFQSKLLFPGYSFNLT